MITPLDIERATIRAWPAAETEERFGWFLLASGGVTGRVNAAWPIGWTGEAAIDAAIEAAERWYSARGLPPRFKLTDGAVAPEDLPEALARRGYAPTMHTLVMTRALSRSPGEPAGRDPGPNAQLGSPLGPGSPAARASGARGEVALHVEMTSAFDAVLIGSTTNPAELDERRSIALRAPKPAAFAVLTLNERAAAIGMSALAGELAGVFVMRTIPQARRQGCAWRILSALLAWAGEQGAANAFLQVEADNAPAIALYERAGFGVLTSYRFWRKPA